jgi:hypothetical protein
MGEGARSIFSASIALLAGYTFIRVSYYRRFSAEHLKTDRFALHVLGWSFVFYVLGEVIAEFMIDWTPGWFETVQSGLWAAGVTAPVANAILLGFFLALFDNIRVRYLMRRDASISARSGFWEGIRIAAVARFVRKSNDSALRAIFRATILKKPLMVTLKSHKVYVGKPYLLLWDDPTQVLTFIKILPIKSGYRDPDTKKVSLPTRYNELSDRLVELEDGPSRKPHDVADPLASDILGLTDSENEIMAQVDIEDLGVVIAWSEVESLTIYDDNLYKAFQEQTPSPVAVQLPVR